MDTAISILFGAIFLIGIPAIIICGVRWACEDAERRGASKLLALALVVTAFPVGLWIWMAIRPRQRRSLAVRQIRRRRVQNSSLLRPPDSP
jgi:hypothetical protein